MKKFFLFLSIIITGGLIYLVQSQLSPKIEDSWTNAIYIALNLNLFCLPIFGFLNKALNIDKKFQRNYFTNRSEHLVTILYKLLFVKYFKQLVTLTSPKRNHLFRPNLIEALLLERSKTEAAEISHTLPYPILITFSIFFLIYLKIKLSVLILLFSIPLHLMPILLQRKNRSRIQKLLQQLPKEALVR